MKTETVYLSLGSNLGDRRRNLRRAIELLSASVRIVRVSPVYDTAPVGNTDQPRFLNMACRGATQLSPQALLSTLKRAERALGRKPGPPNGPRPIDIDILFYGRRAINTPRLIVPHPRLTGREFVLAPLADIAPGLRHPVSGETVRAMLAGLKRTPGDAVPAGSLEEERMYEISVEKDFDAAHFLRGYQGKCESLHGHRFKVVATVKAAKLDRLGMGYDFALLKKHLGEVLARYDHTCLNDITPYKRLNPSSENIAAMVYRELGRRLKGAPVELSTIEVWESPESHVTYRPGD